MRQTLETPVVMGVPASAIFRLNACRLNTRVRYRCKCNLAWYAQFTAVSLGRKFMRDRGSKSSVSQSETTVSVCLC